MDSIIYKNVLNKVKSKAKISLLIKIYIDILEEQEKKKDEEVLQTRFQKEMNEFIEVRDVEEGHHTCKNCGGKKTISNFVQIRSSDEGMDEFVTCVRCANRWKE